MVESRSAVWSRRRAFMASIFVDTHVAPNLVALVMDFVAGLWGATLEAGGAWSALSAAGVALYAVFADRLRYREWRYALCRTHMANRERQLAKRTGRPRVNPVAIIRKGGILSLPGRSGNLGGSAAILPDSITILFGTGYQFAQSIPVVTRRPGDGRRVLTERLAPMMPWPETFFTELTVPLFSYFVRGPYLRRKCGAEGSRISALRTEAQAAGGREAEVDGLDLDGIGVAWTLHALEAASHLHRVRWLRVAVTWSIGVTLSGGMLALAAAFAN